MRYITLLTGIIILLVPAVGKGQVMKNLGGQRAGISAMPFLKLEASPKADALGGAMVSGYGDGYAPDWNPAAMTDMDHTTFTASDKLMAADIHNSYFSGVLPSDHNGSWGFSVMMLNAGEMKKRTAFQPDGTGETFSAYNLSAAVSFAKKLSDRFSLGASGKYVREQLAEFHAHTAAIDLGFMYRTDVKDLRFAVAVQHFGPNSTAIGDFDKVIFKNSDANNDLNSFPTPTTFKLGASMRVMEKKNQKLRAYAQLSHPNDNSERLSLGLNYKLHDLLSLRAGYQTPSGEQALPNVGVQIDTRIGKNPLTIHYTVLPKSHLGNYHNFGLSYAINKETR
jgi:hypothetical protein